MQTEHQFQTEVFQALKKAPCLGNKQIAMEVPVPYKHIYIPAASASPTPSLEVWCFKQDIAIYDVLYPVSVGYKTAKVVDRAGTILSVTLEKDNAQHKSDVGLPYVIIETKLTQPVTDVLLAYSMKAQMIKTIFPYCMYILAIFGKISPRTYRHGLNFDAIVQVDTSSVASLKSLTALVCGLLRRSLQEVSMISPPPTKTKGKHRPQALG